VVLSDETFFPSLKSNSLMVTDFWATWCPPCRMMAPVMQELSQQYAGKITFAKVDVDQNPVTSQQFGIMSIPTFLITDHGKVLDVLVGAMPKEAFEKEITKYLK
ncbi:MAG TPA: thioredoxin, partial [Nitrososphaerales archaeon]|nr:thioredoxin [Nitrososphaerales archaeon]